MAEALVTRNATVECSFCGTLNRVDLGRLGSHPKCGSCSRPMLLDRPQLASDGTWERILNDTEVPVVVDFYADWCGPCRVMAPRLDDLARDLTGQVLVLKLDTDRNPGTAERYGIRGIPTLIVFSRGREVVRQVGLISRQQLEELLAKAPRTLGNS